ncbi:MAG: FtsX-like permease family protein [Alphaproteobacteria bacterium]|nr:FtsX-like permease family protein [Alphaproteobacteria bacterium]
MTAALADSGTATAPAPRPAPRGALSLDSLSVALRALRVNALRSALTMLGIIIGVGAVIVMVAIGSGAHQRVAEQIRSLGSNLIILLPGAVTTGGARLGTGTRPSLTEEDAVAITRELPIVEVAAPTVRGQVQVVFGNQNWSSWAVGTTADFLVAREWNVAEGRLFTPEEMSSAAKVTLLGKTVAEKIFGDGDPVGQVIRIRHVPFTIIGVLDKKGQSTQGTDQDDFLMTPITTAKRRLLGFTGTRARAVGSILVKVTEGESMKDAEDQIRDLLRQRHKLQARDDDDFNLRNLADIMETREASSRILSLLLLAVASVSLIVGGIGIMNIMLVSVTERTREIGLRMAVGARGRDILVQFLVEAVTLSLIGGTVGIALGVAGSVAIASFAGWPTLIEPLAILIAFLFSGAVGVFFGFYPAKKASELDPIEALRFE